MLLPDEFQVTVCTAGTQKRLSATTLEVIAFTVQALDTNTGFIMVGSACVSACVAPKLNALKAYNFPAVVINGQTQLYDLNEIWIDSTVSGEKARVSYLVHEPRNS